MQGGAGIHLVLGTIRSVVLDSKKNTIASFRRMKLLSASIGRTVQTVVYANYVQIHVSVIVIIRFDEKHEFHMENMETANMKIHHLLKQM